MSDTGLDSIMYTKGQGALLGGGAISKTSIFPNLQIRNNQLKLISANKLGMSGQHVSIVNPVVEVI